MVVKDGPQNVTGGRTKGKQEADDEWRKRIKALREERS